MSEQVTVTVIVARGCVDVGGDESFEREGRAASLAHTRRYRPGEKFGLPAVEAARLQKLGVVTLA